jgi:hypothetical protein
MDLAQTQQLLKTAQKFMLSANVKRDAVVIAALERKTEFYEIQALLDGLDMPVLGEGK